MRSYRTLSVWTLAAWLCFAAASLRAAVLVSAQANPTSLAAGATSTVQALVTGDSTNSGVSWSCTVSPSVSGACSTVPASSTVLTSGFFSFTYAAPSAIGQRATVTITATAKADPSASSSPPAQITLTPTATTPTIDIGTGAPNQSVVQEFVSAFYRNNFNNLVGLPPLGNVKALGSTAGYYVQEFPDAANTSGVKYALASASAVASGGAVGGTSQSVVQIYGPEYAYYLTVGASTAGYPLSDTLACPSFDPSNSCMFQFFDKSYALFVYANALLSGVSDLTVRQGIYTEWMALGGVTGIGRPISVETAVTATVIAPATKGSTATAQTFSAGAIYSITAGSSSGQVHGVSEPFYDMYVADGGPTGPLGLPISEVIVNTVTGLRKQNFEGGVLQYTPGGNVGTQYPVKTVTLTGAAPGTTVTLSLGQTLTLTATPMDIAGDLLTGLAISWSSTNGQVISVAPQPNGQSAVLTAVRGGAASVTAASGGVTSASISLLVLAPCCQVGDGAPLAVQSAFQTAVTRDKIAVQLPASAPASRLGSGYVQMVQSSGTPPVNYLLAQSDQSGSAYVVSGILLSQYQNLGGPAGSLGYPISDATAGGTQLFQNGALSGNPVHLVSGGVLAKWASLGYETGAAGVPVADAVSFSTFGANSGVSQNFVNGAIYSASSGPRAGSAYFVSGIILTAYNAAGGPGGDLGMPVGDEFVSGGTHQQNFEGGSVSYTVGAASAQVQTAPKIPAVIVAPASISAGAHALLAISGFPNGSPIRVSMTGQPDFVVTAANGAYSWDYFVPLTASSGSLTIQAADTRSTAAATGTLTIKGFDRNRVQIAQLGGNNQTGAPGSLLPAPFQVALLDSSGASIVGAPVTFRASTGTQLSVSAAVTDANGQASTYVRLPNAAGTIGVSASSAIAQSGVTFYAVAVASALSNFPNMLESGSAPLGAGPGTIGQKGALLSAVAAILRYQQNRNIVSTVNGLADAPTLNQYLTAYCGVDVSGNKVCDGFLSNPASGEQIVNLWRAAQFTGGLDVTVLTPAQSAVIDLVSQGEPVLLSLGLSSNGVSAGGHFVVAMGVASDGSIAIEDPSPLFARTGLNDYLNGFTVSGAAWKGTLLGAVRFAVRSPSATRFLLAALSQPPALMSSLAFDISSPSGECGLPLQMPDTVDASGNPPAAGSLVSKLQVCDGLLPAYQIGVGAAQPFRALVTDLATGGSSFDLSGNAPAVYQATRPLLNLSVSPQIANFTAAGVVNAATFTAGIAPGGLVSIFGSGLASSAGTTSVDVDGETATLISASAFQINVVLPLDIAPGTHQLRVKSPYGTAQQPVTVSTVAPEIFLVGTPPVGAVENQDGSLNGPANPAARGESLMVFGTGLGSVTKSGPTSSANSTVTVLLNGDELPVSFAGLTPGFVGLYQVNVPIPAAIAPGSVIFLTLKEGGRISNPVSIAIR